MSTVLKVEVLTKLFEGDCLEVLKDIPTCSIDCVVTDPPYGISFMDQHWDYDVPSVEIWTQVFRVMKPGAHLLSFGGTRTYHQMVVNIEKAGFEIRDQVQWIYGSGFPKGSNLKPSNEPIVLARKGNSGKLNIDECRLESGRWPANTIFDESAAEFLDKNSKTSTTGKRTTNSKAKATDNGSPFGAKGNSKECEYSDAGGASRFFYVAKASPKERGSNQHPTVKPIKLMEHLIKLVCPLNGTALDPFMGSGTTGVAAKNTGRQFIGIEKDADYFEIAKLRIETA